MPNVQPTATEQAIEIKTIFIANNKQPQQPKHEKRCNRNETMSRLDSSDLPAACMCGDNEFSNWREEEKGLKKNVQLPRHAHCGSVRGQINACRLRIDNSNIVG